MSYTFDSIFDRMSKIVHRIDAPFVACVVMLRMSYPVDDWIAHVYVRRSHIYFRSEHFLTVAVLSFSHFLEKLQVFLDRPFTIWAFPSRFLQSPSVFPYLIGVEIADICFAFFYQSNSTSIHFIEIIGSPEPFIPLESQPSYIFFY